MNFQEQSPQGKTGYLVVLYGKVFDGRRASRLSQHRHVADCTACDATVGILFHLSLLSKFSKYRSKGAEFRVQFWKKS